MDREQRLMRAFVELSDTLVADYDVVDLLHRLAEHSVALLDAAAAGILLSDQRGGLKVIAASSERTRLLELFQVQTDQGPCLDCYRTGEPVLVPDLPAVAGRWPAFAERSIAAGFRSVHAVPLRLRAQTVGAMNLFGSAVGPLSRANLEVAQALADTATIGILQERAIRHSEVLTGQLQGALNSRVVIEQAKGVLAQSGGLDMDAAFNALRGYARDTNIRLSDAAAELAGGNLDPGVILAQRAGHQ
jgi:transcriptional regulator with GAF, ATPase, and Fis domain